MELSSRKFNSPSIHRSSRKTGSTSQNPIYPSWIKQEKADEILSHHRAENGLFKGSEDLSEPTTGQGGEPVIHFRASTEIFTIWQKLRQEHWLDDSQLAAKLLRHYEDTLPQTVCSSCQSPLSHFCSTCFVLSPNPQRNQSQDQPASSGEGICNAGSDFQDGLQETSEISNDVNGELKGTSGVGSSEIEGSPQADDTEDAFYDVLQETFKLSDSEDAFHNELEGTVCHKMCVENSPTEDEIGKDNQGEYRVDIAICPKVEAGSNEFADFGENLVACGFCNISFPSVKDLSKHLMTHTSMQWQQLHRPTSYRTSKRRGQAQSHCNEVKYKSVIKLAEAGENNSASADEASDSFKCIYCGAMYKKPLMLTKHLQKHLKVTAFKCCACSESFTSLTELETHIQSHPQSPTKFDSNKDEDRRHQCRICGMRFRHIGFLVNHTAKHTEPQPFWCSQCKSAFQFLADYTGHQCQMTSEGKSELQLVEPHPFQGFSSGGISLEPVHENQDFPCSDDILQCSLKEADEHKKITTVTLNKSCRPENILTNQHGRAADKDSIPEESAAETSKTISKRTSSRPPKKDHAFKCPDCPAVFMYASGLRTHSQKHSGQNAFPCSLCEQSFSSKRGLLTHQEKDHWGSAPITCHECGRVVKSALLLDQHMRLHTGERPVQCRICGETFTSHTALFTHRRTHMTDCYKCSKCGASFTDSTLYKTHMMKHSGFKPYLCSVCGDAFAQQPQLKKHMTKHGQKQYVCEHCGQAFYTAGEHKLHVMRHLGIKPHACELCGKRFLKKEKLKRHHQSVHVQEKPYKCKLCPVAYKDVSRLNEHVRATHTNERPYKCPVCGKAFAKSGCRQAHLRIHKRQAQMASNST